MISFWEKILINLFTPMELVTDLCFCFGNPITALKLIMSAKLAAYRSLIETYQNQVMPHKVFRFYRSTPCGCLKLLSAYWFRNVYFSVKAEN